MNNTIQTNHSFQKLKKILQPDVLIGGTAALVQCYYVGCRISASSISSVS